MSEGLYVIGRAARLPGVDGGDRGQVCPIAPAKVGQAQVGPAYLNSESKLSFLFLVG